MPFQLIAASLAKTAGLHLRMQASSRYSAQIVGTALAARVYCQRLGEFEVEAGFDGKFDVALTGKIGSRRSRTRADGPADQSASCSAGNRADDKSAAGASANRGEVPTPMGTPDFEE